MVQEREAEETLIQNKEMMKLIIWKYRNNMLDDQKDRWRVFSVGYGKGTKCMGGKPHRHWITFSLRNRLFRFVTNSIPKQFWICLIGLEISYKREI